MSEQQLTEQLYEVHRQPAGQARFAAYDALFRNADAAGATAFAFSARMQAISDFHHGGDPARAFLAFSWCLAAADRNPEVVGAHHEHSLLWRFKWIVWALPQFPDIPLDRTMAVLDDMERRYQLAGRSLHAVYQHRWLVAHHVGDTDGAQEWYDRMLTAPRDALSDCAACVPSSQVRHLATLGRYEEAIRVGEPFKNGGCTEQPQWMLAELLLPYLATGRLDEAVEAHRTGYRRIRDDRHHLDNTALHVAFCGRSGNEAAALPLIERHLSWLERPSSPFAAMEFAAAAAQVLGRLRAAGQGELPVRRRSDDGTRRWEATVAEVHDELVGQATALAARFDARNGNTYQSSRVSARMSAPPLVDRLPLTVLAGRTTGIRPDPAIRNLVERIADLTAAGDLAGAARTRLQVAYALRNADRWQDAAEAAEEAVRTLDRAGLDTDAVRCRYLLWELYRRSYAHRGDALAVLDSIGSAAVIPADLPAYEALLEEAGDLLYGDQAADRLLAAAERHRAAGRVLDEFRTLRKALAACASGHTDERLRAVLGRADQLAAEHGDLPTAEVGRLDAIAARIAGADGRRDEALGRVGRAVGSFEQADAPQEWISALLLRARLLLAANRAVEAEAQAREVLTSGEETAAWAAGIVVAKSLQAQGRNDDAQAFMSECGIETYELDEDLDDLEG
jgi:tetratricopeptide (TPR) repeat protein